MVREVHAGGPYAISRVPEPASALFASYGTALQHSFELVQASGVNLWHTEHRGRLGLSGAPRSGLDPELDAGTIGESTAERCGRKSASRI